VIATGKRLALRLCAACVGGGLLAIAAAVLLNPPLLLAAILALNGSIAIWWGVHMFITRRPW